MRYPDGGGLDAAERARREKARPARRNDSLSWGWICDTGGVWPVTRG